MRDDLDLEEIKKKRKRQPSELMKMHSWKIAVLCVGTALTTQLWAQDASDPQRSAQQSGESSLDASANQASTKSVSRIRASELMGVNVTSKSGESLGQIQDLIIKPATGEIQLALIGKGFMAGLGERIIPLPWRALNVRSQTDFVVNVDQRKLQSAPAWNDAENDDSSYIIHVFRFFELEPESQMGSPGASGQQSGRGEGSSVESNESAKSYSTPDKPHEQEHEPAESAPEPDK